MNYWEILLIRQRERGRDGLTLPFLIGSQKYLPEAHIEQNITDLILDMVSNNSLETHVRYCMGTQTVIFEIRKERNFGYYPSYQGLEQSNLSVSLVLKDNLGSDIETLITSLIEDFQDKIDEGHFSAEPDTYERMPVWKAFGEDDDVPFIKNSFEFL